MRVLRVRNDVHYQYFLTANTADEKMLVMDGTPKAHIWVAPEVFIYKSLHKAGALYNFNRDSLILTSHAARILAYFIRMSGEALILPYEEQNYTVLNVTECINCLDSKQSEWITYNPETKRGKPRKYVFYEDRFSESPLFKIPENPYEIFVVDRQHYQEVDFFEVIKENHLEGFTFDEVWRSDDQ